MNVHHKTTVIVGRNNSGKTSLTELFRRLFSDEAASFRLEDFSLASHDQFWNAYCLHKRNEPDETVRTVVPILSVKLDFEYEARSGEFGLFAPFVIDLDESCAQISIEFRYQLKDGALRSLFQSIDADPLLPTPAGKQALCCALRERVTKLFELVPVAIDPTDINNQVAVSLTEVRELMRANFIAAHRGLDDTTHRERNQLGKNLENLFISAKTDVASNDEQQKAGALKEAVDAVQQSLSGKFKLELEKLLPALTLFGYPGLRTPPLITETTLEVERLLANNTRVSYTGANGIHLPESYNGLGTRNLIYILLRIYEHFRSYQAMGVQPAVHVIFLEEPEVHLHPQMQEVFISQLSSIASVFEESFNGGARWPVQFVVTTHSSHIANKASFECIRYFLTREHTVTSDEPAVHAALDNPRSAVSVVPQLRHDRSTVIKNIEDGLTGMRVEDRKFLHEYMTLTRCDLLFADKAILVEGATERILLPRLIANIGDPTKSLLQAQYISTIEVGGANAYLFYDLLGFLELPALIVTDIDSVTAPGSSGQRKKCSVSHGTHTSNASIKRWFKDPDVSPIELLSKNATDKLQPGRCLIYQVPEVRAGPCGRSFEDAFMLANLELFDLVGDEGSDRAEAAFNLACDVDKTEFALKYLLVVPTWNTPKYLRDGLVWLASASTAAELPLAVAETVAQGARNGNRG